MLYSNKTVAYIKTTTSRRTHNSSTAVDITDNNLEDRQVSEPNRK